MTRELSGMRTRHTDPGRSGGAGPRRAVTAVLGERLEDLPRGYKERIAIHEAGHANTLAFWAVARWGLSERDRLIWISGPPEQIIASHPALAGEAFAMIDAAYRRALTVIRRTPQVRAIASALLKRRALAHADIVALLQRPLARSSRDAKGARRKPS